MEVCVMRVGEISSVYYRPQCRKNRIKKQTEGNSTSGNPSDVNFRGTFGKIVGGTLGTGAVVAASMVVAPAIICLAGAGLVAGMVSGDVAEDKINKEGDYKNDK